MGKSITSESRGKFFPPLINQYSVKLINETFKLSQKRSRILNLSEALFPAQDSEIYFHLFGAIGFHEYQSIIPLDCIQNYINQIQLYSKRENISLSLVSAKVFKAAPELLRFQAAGISLAINFPRNSNSLVFLDFLDKLNVDMQGTQNIIKDSRLPRIVADKCFPYIDKFRALLVQFDPNRVYQSELSRRLAL